MQSTVRSSHRERLEETPWLRDRLRVHRFEEILEDALGIPDQELVVFTGKTLWPSEVERVINRNRLSETPPDSFEECRCGVLVDPEIRSSRWLDEEIVCSEGCLRDLLNDRLGETDGRISSEGTELY